MFNANILYTKCPDGFSNTDQGCFFVEDYNLRNWHDAEAACQQIGGNVHLATLDTQQVGTFYYTDGTIHVAPWFYSTWLHSTHNRLVHYTNGAIHVVHLAALNTQQVGTFMLY